MAYSVNYSGALKKRLLLKKLANRTVLVSWVQFLPGWLHVLSAAESPCQVASIKRRCYTNKVFRYKMSIFSLSDTTYRCNRSCRLDRNFLSWEVPGLQRCGVHNLQGLHSTFCNRYGFCSLPRKIFGFLLIGQNYFGVTDSNLLKSLGAS